MIDDVLLSGGADERMLEDFRAVAHCTAASGEDKFLRRPLERLAHFLVGRSSGPNRDTPLYELCHLVNCIHAAGGVANARWNFFLGQDQVRSSACNELFQELLATNNQQRDEFEITARDVSIHYGEDIFSVSFGRMPFLVSLFEFLATMDSMAFHGELNEIMDTMVGSATGRRAIQDAANQLAAALRRYRNQHLFRSGNDDAFNTIQGFLQGDARRSAGDRWYIDDATILAFWQRHNTDAFRTYRNTLERFADFFDAIAVSARLRAAGSAARLGIDREKGEVNPDDLSSANNPLVDQEAWQNPLPLLDQEPTLNIKFFTKTGERAHLSPLMAFGPFAVQLPLSFLRYLSFGVVQAGITAALQFHPNETPPEEHISCANAVIYSDHHDLYQQLLEHIRRMQTATYYALRRSSGGMNADNVVPLTEQPNSNVFEIARRDIDEEPDIPEDEMAEFENTAAGVFRKITRQGFDEDALLNEDHLDGFRIGAGVLYAVDNILKRFVENLKKMDGDDGGLSNFFDEDRTKFAGEFMKLYGVIND